MIDIADLAFETRDLVFIGRIALAGFLSFLIGWERESRGSHAGDRTHALVAIATAAFTSIGVERFSEDAGRIIQGTITGVGFLGAGMILKEGGQVIGLTTAAGIWAVAAVGIMIGSGEYVMGIGLTGLILLVLIKEKLPVLSWFGRASRRQRKNGSLSSSES
ncbi:MAG TPA: MgtC/SapB family protein [Candidatus Binatia bacterium]|nr:MgtC/SapB family protein [Candidatus Binatia bacterium]